MRVIVVLEDCKTYKQFLIAINDRQTPIFMYPKTNSFDEFWLSNTYFPSLHITVYVLTICLKLGIMYNVSYGMQEVKLTV